MERGKPLERATQTNGRGAFCLEEEQDKKAVQLQIDGYRFAFSPWKSKVQNMAYRKPQTSGNKVVTKVCCSYCKTGFCVTGYSEFE